MFVVFFGRSVSMWTRSVTSSRPLTKHGNGRGAAGAALGFPEHLREHNAILYSLLVVTALDLSRRPMLVACGCRLIDSVF